jgi:xanthine dehydrogenase small subunit
MSIEMIATNIQFLLNEETIILDNVDPNTTVLQYLRQDKNLSGTKEGCASGDCGACTAVIAELSFENPTRLNYKSLNSCISFIGHLHGKQLITVEHLQEGGKLHPVQQAMVDNHGSQCGFCTPGFVMSMFSLHKNNSEPSTDETIEALAGNLCRCTGYRSIIDAATTQTSNTPKDKFSQLEQKTISQLIEINQKPSAALQGNKHTYFSPKTVAELAQLLLNKPSAKLVAGGTDLALSVTQMLKTIDDLIYVGNVAELNEIKETEAFIEIGAAVPYSRCVHIIGQQYPELEQMIERIGSTQIRNVGTLGGNIGNASPIGDMPPALISLSSSVVLQKGHTEREILLEEYFKDYKVTDLAESEFIKSIKIPKASTSKLFKVYKISKRIDDDISAVLAAFSLEILDGKIIAATLAFGGMAAIPKRALKCEQALIGQTLQQTTIDAAKQALTLDFQPMSDVRASSSYRMTVAQNLIEKCFIELNLSHKRANERTIETRVVNYA